MKSYSSRSKQNFLKSYISFCSYFMRSPLRWSPSYWCLAIIIIVLWWKIEVFLSKHIQEMTIFFISNVTARNKNIWSNVKQLFLNKVINKLDHRQIISYMYQWNKILTTYKGEDMFDLKIVNYFTLSPLKLGDL